MHDVRGEDPALAEVVFCARGISKVCRVGEIEVHALREVDLEPMPIARICWSG